MAILYDSINPTSFSDLVEYMDTLVGVDGLYWSLMSFVTFVVFFIIYSKAKDLRIASSVAFFLSTLLAIMIRMISSTAMPDYIVLAYAVGTAITTGILILSK